MFKIIRACTVSDSLCFVEGLLPSLTKSYQVALLSSPGKELDEVGAKYGVDTIAIPMERHIAPFKDLRSLFGIIRVFKKEKPTIVHSMTPKAGLLCMVAAWLARVPVRIHTFTGLVFPTSSGLKRRILMMTDWMTCACATHIIPEGEGVKNDLIRFKITKKPLEVLGYGNIAGVDVERFSARPEVVKLASEIKEPNTFIFLYVGRIVGDKGINEMCQAFTELCSKYNNIRLLLVGSYEEALDPVSAQTKDLINQNTAIKVVGPKSRDELVAYYAASDCFVFPSYREGFPNTVLEAGAMGLPSIVTDINGSREIIQDGSNGLVITSKNVDELRKAMERMIVDEPLRVKMAGVARSCIVERYERSFVHRCQLDYYEKVLQSIAVDR